MTGALLLNPNPDMCRRGQGEALNVDRQALLSGLFAALAAAPLAPLLEDGGDGRVGFGMREAPGRGASAHGARGRGGAGRQTGGGGPLGGPGGGPGRDWAGEPTPVLLASATTALLVDQVLSPGLPDGVTG